MGLALSGVCELAQTLFPSAAAGTVGADHGEKCVAEAGKKGLPRVEQQTACGVITAVRLPQHQRLRPDDAIAARV